MSEMSERSKRGELSEMRKRVLSSGGLALCNSEGKLGVIPPGNGKKVAVMYSGGMDSTVILAELLEKGYEVIPMSYDDNSLNYKLRKGPAIEQCLQHFGLYDKLIPIRLYEVEFIRTNKKIDRFGLVPGWKMAMQISAMAYCQYNKCEELYLGYNDNNLDGVFQDELPKNIDRITDLYNDIYGTTIKVLYPYFTYTKGDMVKVGYEYGVPFESTNSCLVRSSPGFHCGTCPCCEHRRHSFIQAGVKDPTVYLSDLLAVRKELLELRDKSER